MTALDSPRALFLRSLIPATSGGMFALYSAALGFLAVIVMYFHAGFTNQPMPDHTDALLTASVGMLTAHQVRGALADKANADNGVLPVPVETPIPAEHPPDS